MVSLLNRMYVLASLLATNKIPSFPVCLFFRIANSALLGWTSSCSYFLASSELFSSGEGRIAIVIVLRTFDFRSIFAWLFLFLLKWIRFRMPFHSHYTLPRFELFCFSRRPNKKFIYFCFPSRKVFSICVLPSEYYDWRRSRGVVGSIPTYESWGLGFESWHWHGS